MIRLGQKPKGKTDPLGGEQLSESEYLRRIVESSPNVIYARDHEGRFQFANQAFADLMHRTREEILGMTIAEIGLDCPEQQTRWKSEAALFVTGKRDSVPEEKFTDAVSGEVRWFRTVRTVLPAHGDNPEQVLTIATDLTERKRAEDIVRKLVEGTASATAEIFFRSLVKQLATVLNVRYAFIGQVVAPQNTTVRLLAVYRDGEYVENESYSLSGSPSERILAQGLQQFADNVPNEFPHDTYIRNENIRSYMGVPLLSAAGTSIGILSVMDDKPMPDWAPGRWIMRIFAARAAAEIERLESERQRGELEKQLQQAQKMEAIGQLAAGIAHDLNNALGAVVGHLELLNIAARLDPEWRHSVQTALKGCERASSLIEQLLGFSRQGRYHLQRADLRKITEETLSFLGRIIDKNIKISLRRFPKELPIEVDLAQVQQALTNIVLNAAQAMPAGGQITISFEMATVIQAQRFNAHTKGETFVTVHIQDTGTGIAKENHEKIFEPFFTTKEQGKGSGLGLSMVYGIMQSHGGWISVASEIGVGSNFSLHFPLAATASAEPRDVKPVAVQPPAHGSVLIIDDEEMLVDLSTKFLNRAGFTVHGFTSAKKALEWFAENYQEIQLAIIDMKMPEFDGRKCFSELRAIAPNVPVVILSGYTHDRDVQDLIKKGATAFFQKPLKYPELVNWVRDFLGQSNADDQTER